MDNLSLGCKWAGKEIEKHDCIGSTNARAKELGFQGAPHGSLVLADCQSAGRGRLGREWVSPKGVNLYMSMILRPAIEVRDASKITLVMAVAVARALERVHGARRIQKDAKGIASGIQIKWPNDILVGGKKVCGILTQLHLEKDGSYFLVIGVGINVKRQEFPEELKEKASSLEQEWTCQSGGQLFSLEEIGISREEVLKQVLLCFEETYDSFMAAGNLSPLVDYYEERLVNLNAKVKVLDPKGEWEGISRGITNEGELLVEKDGETYAVFSGEVSVRGEQGYI